MTRNHSLVVDIFRNDLSDIINSSTTTCQNVGETVVMGVELGLESRFSTDIRGGGSISYLQPDKNSTSVSLLSGDKLMSISSLSLRFHLEVNLAEHHRAGIQARYFSATKMLDNAFSYAVVDMRAYHVIDGHYSYAYRSARLDLFIDNILDASYEIGGSKRPMPQPVRVFGLQLSYGF